MDWYAEWSKAQHELSVASRYLQSWQMLPEDRRRVFGRDGYRARFREARRAMKAADQRCRSLIAMKRQAGGEIGRKLKEA